MRGSPRADSRKSEITADLIGVANVPAPPAWFDMVAKAKYLELAEILVAMRVLTAADVDHLAAYCSAYSRWCKSERELKRDGEVVTHKNGVDGRSHWLAVSEAALDRMAKSGAELGLSPTARARLKVSAGVKNDGVGIAKFLKA